MCVLCGQICIFLFVEVVPICVGVRQDVLNHFSERDVGNTAPPVRYQTLPQDPNSIVLDTQHNVVCDLICRCGCDFSGRE